MFLIIVTYLNCFDPKLAGIVAVQVTGGPLIEFVPGRTVSI